jgi:hypothetical protein
LAQASWRPHPRDDDMRFQPVAFTRTREEIGGQGNGYLSAAPAARQPSGMPGSTGSVMA